MATNSYFNPYPRNITTEQNLVEDLLIESIKIYGMDLYYLPRESQDTEDYLFGDDQVKKYTSAYALEMYLENVDGMDGQGDFVSTFGLEIRDEISLLVSRKRFKSTVPNLTRPKEGDLIYVPLVENFFEITFVEHENNQAMFYTLGRGRAANVYVYALKLKQFVFSNEIISTGIDEIDNQIVNEYPKVKVSIDNISGKFIPGELVYQGTSYASRITEAKVFQFNNSNPLDAYLNVYQVHGNIQEDTITGVTSGATAEVILIQDRLHIDNAFEDLIDNSGIQEESDEILDWSEQNPFGAG